VKPLRGDRRIGAVIFDLEGTILQAETLEALSFARAATELRPGLDETEVAAYCEPLTNRADREVAAELLQRFNLERPARKRASTSGPRTPWQVLVDLKLDVLDAALSEPAAVLVHSYPRNTGLARELRRNGRGTALRTRFGWRRTRRALAALGLDDAFDFVAASEDVVRGVPDPESHLLAARELGLPPGEFLAVEGYPDGVEAALAAGMEAVAFTTPITRRRFAGSDLLDHCWAAEDSHALCAVVAPEKTA
jgi:beta-phosphoglucomutase-like phosphatase (HAD superfamily)